MPGNQRTATGKPVKKGKEWNLSSPTSVQGNQTIDEAGSLTMSHFIVPLKKETISPIALNRKYIHSALDPLVSTSKPVADQHASPAPSEEDGKQKGVEMASQGTDCQNSDKYSEDWHSQQIMARLENKETISLEIKRDKWYIHLDSNVNKPMVI